MAGGGEGAPCILVISSSVAPCLRNVSIVAGDNVVLPDVEKPGSPVRFL
jgi:hypothetical protein